MVGNPDPLTNVVLTWDLVHPDYGWAHREFLVIPQSIESIKKYPFPTSNFSKRKLLVGSGNNRARVLASIKRKPESAHCICLHSLPDSSNRILRTLWQEDTILSIYKLICYLLEKFVIHERLLWVYALLTPRKRVSTFLAPTIIYFVLPQMKKAVHGMVWALIACFFWDFYFSYSLTINFTYHSLLPS